MDDARRRPSVRVGRGGGTKRLQGGGFEQRTATGMLAGVAWASGTTAG